MTTVRIPRPTDPELAKLWDEAKQAVEARARLWAPQACTAAIGCPECGVPAGERCLSDRPLHLARWDAWAAIGYRDSEEQQWRRTWGVE